MKKEHAGIFQMIICAMLWSIAGIFLKLLPWNGLAAASLRSLFAGITISIYMIIRHYRFSINRETLRSGILTGCVYLCFSVANKLTTAANAIVLQFTAPVFIVIFSSVFYKKKIRKTDLAVVLVVLAGIALFFFDQLGPSTVAGNLVAIAAGMFMAGMFMTVDHLAPEARFSAVLLGQCFAFLAGLPAVILTKPVLNTVTVPCILVLGIFQLGISYILYVKASENCPALACCLLSAVEPLLNPVWVMIFDGETPGICALIGGVIVITAVTLWTIWNGKQKTETVV